MNSILPSGADTTAPLHERLLSLWATPIPDPHEAQSCFAALYTDPVTINGSKVPLRALVDRANHTHAAFERLSVEVLDVLDTPGKIVFAFNLTARHVGNWPSSLGHVSPTGRIVTVRTIDMLTLHHGRVNTIWAITDEAALLAQLRAHDSERTNN